MYFSVWLVFYTRTYVYDKNIQFLDKESKALHLHLPLLFWKSFPFHDISLNPCSLMRPTEQVEFSHFEVTERTSNLLKTTDWERTFCFQFQSKHGKLSSLGSHRKAMTILSCPLWILHATESTADTSEIVTNKEEVPLFYSWPVLLVHPVSSQICLTYNVAYHSCQDAISEGMPRCNVHPQTKRQEVTPREKSFTPLSYWFHPCDYLGINKVAASPGCELGAHLDRTSDTTRKARRLQGH